MVEDAARRRDSRWRAPLVAVALTIAFVIVVVGTATIGDNFPFRLDIGRQRLSPIPVSIEACPYLRPVHDVSVRLNDQWMRALHGREEWPLLRAGLAADLPRLERALKRAVPHVPAQIGSTFEIVVVYVHIGRAQLPRATSANDVLFPSGDQTNALNEGVNALADASDLVGGVCGYRLAPSNPLAP